MSKKRRHFEFIELDGMEVVRVSDTVLRFEKHTHTTDFTCSVITEGETLVTFGDKEMTLGKNGFFTVLPNCPHSITSEKSASMISLCIHSDFIKKYQNHFADYKSKISRALDSAGIDDGNARLLCDAADGIFELYQYANTHETNDTEKISYYSRYHYIRKFNSKLGLTPHKYRLQCRIREAQKLLRDGYSSADAAAEKDFYDQSHFIRCFKTVVGITPLEYKESVRNFLQYKQSK